MVKINYNYLLTPAEYKKVSYGTGNTKEYVCVHTTDNWSVGADAEAHAKLQKNGNSRSASWHYTVDKDGAYQSLPESIQAWHAGAGNSKSIAIEICVNKDGDFAKAASNAAYLTAAIMKRNNIPISKVKQHNFFTGKNCPRELREGKDGWDWEKFIKAVEKAYNGSSEVTQVSNSSEKDVKGFLIAKQELNYYSSPRWDNPSGKVKANSQHTIVGSEMVDGVKMYETDKGNYITSSDKYIKYYTKKEWKEYCSKKTVKGYLVTKTEVNYYDSPRWERPSGQTKKGSKHTIVGSEMSDGVKMYETDSGNYITSSDKYVTYTKK